MLSQRPLVWNATPGTGAGVLRWGLLIIGVGLLALPGFALTNYISIKESQFIPEQLVVVPGDTVVWMQEDNTEHTVTSQNRYLNSGALAPGEEFSFTFNELGAFPYFCVFHGAGAMAGVITVVEPSENAPPQRPVNLLPPEGATNQPVTLQLDASAFFDSDPEDFHAASQWVIRYAHNESVAVDSGAGRGGGLTNYRPAGLIEGTAYTWQVRYRDGRGGWSEYSAPTRFTTQMAFSEPGCGLRASFFNDPNFSRLAVVVTNSVLDFDWAQQRPDRRVTADEFAVRWEGRVLPKFSELYQLEFEFRGRARMWVNGELLLDEWTPSPFILARRVTTRLTGGQLVPVRIDYVASAAGGAATLRWLSPSVVPEVIPTLRLFPPAP